MSVYQLVRDYHAEYGDDVSEPSRLARYDTIMDLVDLCPDAWSVLDVGCGSGQLKRLLNSFQYTGIDLLDGVNVLDHHEQADIVVANGIFYKLPDRDEAWKLIRHMWDLCRHAVIFTSLSSWAPYCNDDELYLDPLATLSRCHHLTSSVALRHDYLPHDFTIGLFKCRGETPASQECSTATASNSRFSSERSSGSSIRLAA